MVAGSIIFQTSNTHSKNGELGFHKRDSIHISFSKTVPKKGTLQPDVGLAVFRCHLNTSFKRGGLNQDKHNFRSELNNFH